MRKIEKCLKFYSRTKNGEEDQMIPYGALSQEKNESKKLEITVLNFLIF